jgi:hypothetical protein
MKRLTALLLAALATVGPSAGCYSYHVYQIGGPQGVEMGNQPGTEWKEKTLHSFLWGQVRQDLPVDNCQLANGQRFGIEEVTVRSNFGYSLLTVATVGIWAPIQVRWRCAKPPVPTGPLQ